VIKQKLYNAVKYLLKVRIHYLIKKAFQVAEHSLRVGQGENKLSYAVNFIAKKTKLLPYFKSMLAEILIEEFEQHKDEINQMIIRKPIRI